MKEEKEKIPLKTILQNFLNHVQTLEAKRKEGDDLYEKEFQSLKAFSDELKSKEDYSSSDGDKEVNRKKNRYKDILPFNYSRVLLSEYPGVPGSDYINANYIKGASGSNAYIASQGPLPHTVNDWWRMVVECEVQVIVMACNEQEAGKHKCECYWTSESEEGEGLPPPKMFGKFTISLLKSREICPDFLVRTMRLTWLGDSGQQEERTVCQFHYSAWPDHGIPTQVKPLLEMVRLIRDCQASETLPVLIHCSAGCGRTGTICAIDFVWGLLRTGKLDSKFSLYNLVQDMRRQRIAMVQTVDQYMLCHRAVKELFLEQLRVIDSHPYENVGNDGRPLCVGGSQNSLLTPDYETIFVKGGDGGSVDIERVLSQRQNLPKMGVNMLSRDKESHGGENKGDNGADGSESSENSLPTTLDDFKRPTPDGTPKIHEPPKVPESQKESAPQRFKKGNLRILKADDGGWKLEELALEEKRRSLESAGSPRDELLDNLDEAQVETSPRKISAGEKPPQGDVRVGKDRSKKKNSREEKSESQLLRRPSMKKIKAFFDKDKNKENKEVKETESSNDLVSDSDFASAVSKLPSLEVSSGTSQSIEDGTLTGSKSVPSSLDRKQRYRDSDFTQIGNIDAKAQDKNNMSKYWPLNKRENKQHPVKSVSSERLQVGDKPALPVKRSKSMKSISKPVSVIPIITTSGEPSFRRGEDDESSPYDTYPKLKPRSEELIDLTKGPSQEIKDPSMVSSNYNYDQNQQSQGSKQTYHFGERGTDPRAGAIPPPKPKRDWSSLNHDYANMKMSKDQQSSQEYVESGNVDKENIRSQLRDFVNVKMKKELPVSHLRQGSNESLGKHYKQSSGDSTNDKSSFKQPSGDPTNDKRVDSTNDRSSEFFDQQMAKLLARKGLDETDGLAMKRSKSGDIPRPDNLSLIRSVSGDCNQGVRNMEILDDDARKMLRDCQEYLLGAFDPSEEEGRHLKGSSGNSPLSTHNQSLGGRSVHSSPGNSFNKYGSSTNNLKRSSSGNLNLSPPGTIQKSVSSPTGTIQKSFCSPAAQKLEDLSPTRPLKPRESDYNSYHSDASDQGSSKHSPLSENGPSSLEGRSSIPEYENIENRLHPSHNNLALEARGKLSAATSVPNRERRNSFRQAVTDKPPAVDQFGRPYEQIWFQGGPDTDSEISLDTRLLADGPVYVNATKAPEKPSEGRTQLRKSDTGSSISLRSQASSTHVRSGSYDNIPTPHNIAAYSMLEPSVPPGSGYEVVSFREKNSLDSMVSSESVQAGLQSVGLVAEACRDYERSQPTKQALTKQHSGSNIRAPPPPYQAPPGPPPPYQPPPSNITVCPGASSPSRQHPSPGYPNKQQVDNSPKRQTYTTSQEWRVPPGNVGARPAPFYSTPPGGFGGPTPSNPTQDPTRPTGVPAQELHQDLPRSMGGPTLPQDLPRHIGSHTPPHSAMSPPSGLHSASNSRPSVSSGMTRIQPRDQTREAGKGFRSSQEGSSSSQSRDDSELSLRQQRDRTEESREARHRKRNSSLVTTTRLGLGSGHPEFFPQGMPSKGVQVVQGARTAVMVGGMPPGTIDLDRVAASISSNSVEQTQHNPKLQFGRSTLSSMAGVLSGAAQNIKSKIAGIGSLTVGSPSPSPPDRGRGEPDHQDRPPLAIPLTVPGAEVQHRDYGYPIRLEKRPQGPRETPNFQKKQEYL